MFGRLRVNGARSPVGVPRDDVRFSWSIGGSADAVELEVTTSTGAPVWRRLLRSAESAIRYGGPPLESYRRYEWRVRGRSGSRWSGWVRDAFVAGQGAEDGWDSLWIWAPNGDGIPVFRDTFRHTPGTEIYLVMAACGYAAATINGRAVTPDVLVPAWTDYTDRPLDNLLYPYQVMPHFRQLSVAYDISPFVRSGDNDCAIELAGGWFAQEVRTVEGNLSYGRPRVSALVFERDGDDLRVATATGPDWVYDFGDLRSASIFGGTVFETTIGSGVRRAEVAPHPEGEVSPSIAPRDRAVAAGAPRALTSSADGGWIVDAGRNGAGWLRLTIEAEQAGVVDVRYAEHLDDNGCLDFSSAGGAAQIQSDSFVHDGSGPRTFEPRHTWHGFRYAEIRSSAPMADLAVEVVEVGPQLEQVGTLEVSDPVLGGVEKLFRRSFLSNLHSGVPSDCPHRERLGYTGDAHVVASAALWRFDLESTYREYVQRLVDAQDRISGFVPHTVPFAGGGGGPGWGSAVVLMPWQHYLAYGDPRILSESVDAMIHWVSYLRSRPTDPLRPLIVDREEPGSWFLGDWAWPGCTTGAEGIDPRFVATYFFAECARIVRDALGVLGRRDDAVEYDQLFRAVRGALHAEFLDPITMEFAGGVGGAGAFGLALGGLGAAGRARAEKALVERYATSRAMDTGIFGTPLLLDALSGAGASALALELVSRDVPPGYGAMLARGATTLWEHWDGSESHNHPMFGSVTAWATERIAGLRRSPRRPLNEEFIVDPFADGAVASAAFRHQGPAGAMSVDWTATVEKRSVVIEVPAGATALLVDRECGEILAAGEGRHEVEWFGAGSGRASRTVSAAGFQPARRHVGKRITNTS